MEFCEQCVRLIEYPSEYDATDNEEVRCFLDKEKRESVVLTYLWPLLLVKY